MKYYKYISLIAPFLVFLTASYILYYLEYYFYSLVFLVLLISILFIILLRLYKFYYYVLKLLQKENIYIENTLTSFFLNPNNELLRYKSTFDKKIKIYEKNLTEEKNKYSQLLNSIPLPLALINANRFILYANNLAKESFSSSFEGSFLHQHFRDPILKKTIDKINKTLESSSFQLKCTIKNDTFIYNVEMRPTLSDKNKILYYLVIFINQNKISKSIQERNDFLANASHELKTPLTNILGISEIISNNSNALLENKSFGKNLYLNAKRMQYLINSLLDLSKVEINKNIIEHKDHQLNTLINLIIKEYKSSHPKNYNIKIINNLKSKKIQFKTDEKELNLLFFNLLDNSFKYGASLVKIFLEKKNENVVIKFHDDGMGIPNNELQRVTERFYRVKGSEKIEGNGLGLAIVKEIMNNHKGEIKIKSEKKRGTTVSLIF